VTISVSDSRSNPADQVAHAVEVLGRAKQRIAVFKSIYTGKKKIKTVNEIATATGLDRIRVLQEGKRLVDNQIVKQISAMGMTAYEKDPFYSVQRNKILRLVRDPIAFSRFPTKTRPKGAHPTSIVIRIPRPRIQARYITVDDIDSFRRVQGVRVEPGDYTPVPEKVFKRGVAKILGESGRFQDWGGERNDLYTSRITIDGKRHPAAFAVKDPVRKASSRHGEWGRMQIKFSVCSKPQRRSSSFSTGARWRSLSLSKWRSSLRQSPRLREE
jgi:hypothetical protein